jgi:hypothetical protein
VVVADGDGAGASEDGGLEDLARVDKRGCGGAHGDDLVTDAAVAAVEVDGHEVLTGIVRDDAAHEGHGGER